MRGLFHALYAHPALGPEFPLVLDLVVVFAISIVMLTLAALSFRKKG